MATGAVVNAAWDLAAKRAGEPAWRFLGQMSPEELVGQVDFRWLSDALTPQDALDILRARGAGQAGADRAAAGARLSRVQTSPGWLGYSDEKLSRLAREAVTDGFTQIKLKVGASLDDDIRRMKTARAAVGDDIRIAVDANQRWDVQPAIDWMRQLAPYDPYWIEEPTSPDDILGHAAVRRALRPIKVATGEHIANRVVFKQLLQAGAVDIVQIDSARVGGINENIAILLLAAKFGVPVCPHAGGVGLCEMVQHLSMFDYVAVSATTQDRVIEYVDHLHDTSSTRYASSTAGTSPPPCPDSAHRCSRPPSPSTTTPTDPCGPPVSDPRESPADHRRTPRMDPAMTALAVSYTAARVLETGPAETRQPGPGEVEIAPAYVGICGTDLHIFHGSMDARVRAPAVLGHEMSGRITRVGSGVTGWQPGDPVTVMPLIWDGDCAACTAGHQHICHNLNFIGIDSPGAMQQRWTVPAETLVRLPASLALDHAALVEPTAVAVHDVGRAGVNR